MDITKIVLVILVIFVELANIHIVILNIPVAGDLLVGVWLRFGMLLVEANNICILNLQN